ncbi:helix-turn-helix transcriptional regulator [Luteimonas terricola]|uniref:helix-turn-helix transcriptional regulator n=1 Tax=Luteimonas terricola TaxID=645597 RepID=UPI0010465DB9|nr:helix-turn-helix transcriptional regulator [Luteimonas terricola]
MDVEFWRAGQGGGIDLTGVEGVHCVRGFGRGSHALVAAASPSLWCVLRGSVEVRGADGAFRVPRRHFLALPAGAAVRALGRDGADWVALALPPPAVAAILRSVGVRRGPGPLLFSSVLPMDRALLRAVAAVARAAGDGQRPAMDILLGSVLQAARDAQAPSRDWVARASGRTEGHRRQTVQRLLSAHSRILNSPFEGSDLDSLAAAARYSKSHFLRSFRDVFGITPHDLVIQTRMELAKDLIANSDLAISEVAASVGYESRFAFARSFKKCVGLTATRFRQDLADAA